MNRVKHAVEAGLDISHRSHSEFTQILAASKVVKEQIQEVSTLTRKLVKRSEWVNQSMDEVTSFAKQSVDGTQHIALITDKQHKQTETTFNVSKELSKLTKELDGIMIKLKE